MIIYVINIRLVKKFIDLLLVNSYKIKKFIIKYIKLFCILIKFIMISMDFFW